MSIYLRQICLAAEQLAPVIDDLKAVFSLGHAYVDPAVKIFGLENTLLSIGTSLLETVAPIKPDTAAGRFITRQGGDCGYMVICQAGSPDVQTRVREAAAANQVRIAFEHEEKGGHKLMQLHPKDMGGTFFEVDWDNEADFTGHWYAAGGTDWQGAIDRSRVTELAGAAIACPDPHALAQHWQAVSGLPLDGTTLQFENARLRFIKGAEGTPAGLREVDLNVNDTPAIIAAATARNLPFSDNHVEICGVRFNLHS